MKEEIHKHNFPWKVIKKNNNRNQLQQILRSLDERLNNLSFKHLQYLWEFLHVYYVVNRTLKSVFYIDYIENEKEDKKKIDLYFTPEHSIYPLIKPQLLPVSPVNKLPKEIKDAYFCCCYKGEKEKTEFCQDGNIQKLKKELELIIKYNCHILNLNEDEFSFKEKDFIDFGEVSYLVGLYRLFSWDNLNKDFLNVFDSVFEPAENIGAHSLFERLYNKVTSLLIVKKIKEENGINIEFSNNCAIEVPGLFFKSNSKNNIEIDITFWNRENRKIVFMETTTHKKEKDEWRNHFTKKSAISNILFQQAKNRGWSIRYIYFYSFGFSFAEQAFGVENFFDNGTHFIFLPMWNFKQYKFFLNFDDKRWVNRQRQKNKPFLCDNIESELKNILDKLVAAVSNFLL